MRTQFRVSRLLLSRSFLCLFVFCLLLRGGAAQGQAFDISIMFMPDTKTVMQGDTNPVNYTALFSNNTMTDLLISGATFNSTNSDFFTTFGNSGFFNGTNGSGDPTSDGSFMLAANQKNLQVTDVVSLFLTTDTPPGTYAIDATFTGRDFSDANNPAVFDRDLGTGRLNVTVQAAGAGSPTPEFGSVWTLGGLLLAGGIGAWRQHRRHPTTSGEASHVA